MDSLEKCQWTKQDLQYLLQVQVKGFEGLSLPDRKWKTRACLPSDTENCPVTFSAHTGSCKQEDKVGTDQTTQMWWLGKLLCRAFVWTSELSTCGGLVELSRILCPHTTVSKVLSQPKHFPFRLKHLVCITPPACSRSAPVKEESWQRPPIYL